MANGNKVSGGPAKALNQKGRKLHLSGSLPPEFFGDPDIDNTESTLDWKRTVGGEFYASGVRNPPRCQLQ